MDVSPEKYPAMQPHLIISAIVRLVSLQYAFLAVSHCVSLPAHISMLADSMSDTVKSAGRSGLVSDSMNIGSNIIIAVILWFLASHIASFVLKTLEKGKSG